MKARLLTEESRLLFRKSNAASVFEYMARRERALEEWKKVEADEHETWTVHALFGYYVHLHKDRYFGWKLSAQGGVEVVRALRTLARREGMAEAVRAVEAVFGQKWIDGRQWTFLEDRDKYAKFVHPHLSPRGGREQSEWTGRRHFTSKRHNAAEFFGRGS